AGIKTVLIPARNERDLDDIPQDVREQMNIILIKRVEEILPLILEPPVPSGDLPSMPPPPPPSSAGDVRA
ncbi:MAG: S16 family serine protease, partial [Polyangiaceae bacterium]